MPQARSTRSQNLDAKAGSFRGVPRVHPWWFHAGLAGVDRARGFCLLVVLDCACNLAQGALPTAAFVKAHLQGKHFRGKTLVVVPSKLPFSVRTAICGSIYLTTLLATETARNTLNCEATNTPAKHRILDSEVLVLHCFGPERIFPPQETRAKPAQETAAKVFMATKEAVAEFGDGRGLGPLHITPANGGVLEAVWIGVRAAA